MEPKQKLLIVLGIMAFSLMFALSPSHPRGTQTSTSTSRREEDSDSNSFSVSKDKSNSASLFEKDYPKYDKLNNDEEQENLTPEDFEKLDTSAQRLRKQRSRDSDEDDEEDEEEKEDLEDEQEEEDEEEATGEVNEKDEEVNKVTEKEDSSIFVDGFQFDNAPTIKVLAESKKIQYRLIVLQHERYYRTHSSKLYVPRLKKTVHLSVDEFARRFLYKSQPVIVPFESMRHLNFTTKSYTLSELLKLYPNHQPAIYKYGTPDAEEEIDLGPAIATLSQGIDLKKTQKGRNFPRNMKVNLKSMQQLNVQWPAYVVKGTQMMAPSVWFGTTSSSTKTHSDCCDNYAMMISGTKRWTIAPPSESRVIKPKCNGGLCWGNKLEHADEHANTPAMIKLRDQTQLITFDLGPGEMLYLPCGWFHHVENVGPTIMVNFWTKDKPYFLQLLDGDVKGIEG